ncbi:MAG TPA: zinc ribbon domain-containing protein [Bryobacteraceae bacterium]|nr:zinc ribbon domain-containing protein [Bryobacteraceae bacterium]
MTAAVALLFGTILFTLFVRAKDIPETPAPSPTAHLDLRKAQIYENLRDLQFEFRLGKLSDEDYQKTKLDLQRELARVLAEIDAIQPPPEPKPAQAKAAAAPAKPQTDDRSCPHCGAKFAQPMKFCGQCGKAMAS